MTSEQQVAYRYICMLQMEGYEPEQDEQDTDCGEHLLWMLYQIYDDKLSSRTKAHRWLGYVQAMLIMQGVTTVDIERNKTRDIFNGE